MSYSEELKKRMSDLGLSAAELSRRSGVSQASISGYLSGRVPSEANRDRIASVIGLVEARCETLSVRECAGLMKKSTAFVEKGLQEGVFPFGYAVKLDKWCYFISAKKFTEATGIEV
jgi:transcriptional regulator with XRE-family HTH domain